MGWAKTLGVVGGAMMFAIGVEGCCVSPAFLEGVAEGLQPDTERQRACVALVTVVNAAATRLEALPPDPLAEVADPTPEQMEASVQPVADAYLVGANEIAAVTTTDLVLVAERDGLATLYREAASTVRDQAHRLAEAMRVGDQAAIDAIEATEDTLPEREEQIIRSINETCSAAPPPPP